MFMVFLSDNNTLHYLSVIAQAQIWFTFVMLLYICVPLSCDMLRREAFAVEANGGWFVVSITPALRCFFTAASFPFKCIANFSRI